MFKITISKEYKSTEGGYHRENDLYIQRVNAIDIAQIADIVNKVERAYTLSKQDKTLDAINELIEGK